MKPSRLFCFGAVCVALASACLFAQGVSVISNNGDPANRVDLVIVGDGYTAEEMPKFASDAAQLYGMLVLEEPFQEYRRYFNVRRVDVVSAESGASHLETDPPVVRNTALEATFGCGGIPRLICVNVRKLASAVSVLPKVQRDFVVVLVNDSTYGGSGGTAAVVSLNDDESEAVLHELGHSLGLLADEYFGGPPPPCDDSSEPPEENATRENTRASIKWTRWIAAGTSVPTTTNTPGVPGLYVGARYCPTTLYRPTYESRMRTLHRPFEQINTEQLIRRFYSIVSPLDSFQPALNSISVIQGATQVFFVATPKPLSHTLQVRWTVDGIGQLAGTTYTLDSSALSVGTHIVASEVRDTTPMVLNDPSRSLLRAVRWNVTVQLPPAIEVVPPAYDFGPVSMASTVQKDFIIQNTGASTLTVTGVNISTQGDFSPIFPAPPFNVAPNTSNSFTVFFKPIALGPRQGTVTITSNAPTSPTSVLLSGSGIAPVIPPDVTITKTASPNPVTSGGTVTYTITVTNAAGTTDAVNVTVADPLDSRLSYQSCTASQGGGCSPLNGIPRATFPILAGGASATFTIQVTAPTVTTSTQISNTATVTADNEPPANTGNNSASQTTTITAGSLVALYKLDGNADDATGNGNNGTVFGGVTYVPGKVGQGASFDGSTGYISIADSAGLRLSTFTFAAWVYPTAIEGGNRIIEKGNSDSYWLDINPQGQPLVGFFNGAYHDLLAPQPVSINTWYHVAGTYDGSDLKLYLNGQLVNTVSVTSAPLQTNEPLFIGWKYGGIALDHFAGIIDEVRIYNYALNQNDIQVLASISTLLYVSVYPDNKIAAIDSSLDKVVDTIPLPSQPTGIAASKDGRVILAVLSNINKLAKITLPGKAISQIDIPAGVGAVALHPNGQKAYVPYSVGSDWFVGVVDLALGTLNSIPVSAIGDYGDAWINNINIAPSGAKAYVSWGVSSDISVIDTVQDKFINNIYSPPSYHDEVAFTPDSTLAIASSRGLNCYYNGGFSKIDAVNDQNLYSDYLSYGTEGAKWNADGTKAYVAGACAAKNVLVFNVANNTIEDDIPTGITAEQSSITIVPELGKAYVGSASTLTVLDFGSRSVVGTISLSTTPFGLPPTAVTSAPAVQ